MLPHSLPRKIDVSVIQFVLLWIMFFSLPLSSSATMIAAGIFMIVWFFSGNLLDQWLYLKKSPLFWAWLSYTAIYPISLLWTENPTWINWLIERHLYFLIFPFIFTTIRKDWVIPLTLAFISAMVLTAIYANLSYHSMFGLTPHSGHPIEPLPIPPHVFGRFIYAPMLAWAIILLTYYCLFYAEKRAHKIIGWGLFALLSIHLFDTGGRSGWLVLFLLFPLAVTQYLATRFSIKKALSIGAVSSIVLIIGIMSFSNPLQKRVLEGFKNLNNPTTSWGARVYFATNTLNMVKHNPILGVGFGDFPETFDRYRDRTIFSTELDKLKFEQGEFVLKPLPKYFFQPHNQFLYDLASIGIVGFSMLVAIIMIQLWQSFRRPVVSHPSLAAGFALFCPLFLFPDALLIYIDCIFTFVLFSAILFGNRHSETPNHVT